MFEQMLLPTGGTHQARNTALAFLGEAILVAVAVVVIPLVYVAHIPEAPIVTTLVAPPLPPSPPPPLAATAKHPYTRPYTAARVAPRMFTLQPLVAPKAVPQDLPLIADNPPALPDLSAAGQIGGVFGGVPGGIAGGVLGGVAGAFPAPPANAQVAVQKPTPKGPIRVGGEVEAARLSHQVVPSYPVIAREAHIAGTVALSATIAPDGTVKDLHVLSGNPLLIDAAVNAVKQWTYRPTYLNGKPVEVLTEVDVRFSLG